MPAIDPLKPGLAGVLMPGGFQYNLTPLGQQLAQQNSVASTPSQGGQYNFDVNTLLGGTGSGWGDVSFGQGEDHVGEKESSPWLHFTGSDGQALAAYREFGAGGYDESARQPTQGALTGYRVFSDPGDFGGTGFGKSHESKMNGIKYDTLDASGKYTGNGVFSGWTDSGIGDALGVLSIFAMAAGGAALAGAGAGAAGGAAAGGAAGGGALGGMAGVAEAGYGAGMTAGAAAGGGLGASAAATAAAGAAEGGIGSLGVDAFETIAAENAAQTGLLTSVGGDAFEHIAEENLAASRAAAATPGTFRPSADSQLANEQLGITGSQAAADAAAAPIPSVTVNGAPGGGVLDGITDSITQAAKSPLGNYLLRNGVSTLLSTIGGKVLGGSTRGGGGAGGSGATTAPPTPAPVSMPDPLAQIRIAQNSIIDQLARRGRESTVLTRTH